MSTHTARQDRNALIASHVDIARRISLRIARRCPAWVAREDLVAAGLLGLAEAAERYDEARLEPFLSFAEKRIRGAVLDELRRGDIMPRRVRQMARRIGQVITTLELELGAMPTDEQVAARLGVTLERYRAELEQLVHVNVGVLEEETLASDSSPQAEAIRNEAVAKVRAALARVSAKDARDLTVLSLHYNEELAYSDIARVLGVTTSRVCQLHARAIERLRAELA